MRPGSAPKSISRAPSARVSALVLGKRNDPCRRRWRHRCRWRPTNSSHRPDDRSARPSAPRPRVLRHRQRSPGQKPSGGMVIDGCESASRLSHRCQRAESVQRGSSRSPRRRPVACPPRMVHVDTAGRAATAGRPARRRFRPEGHGDLGPRRSNTSGDGKGRPKGVRVRADVSQQQHRPAPAPGPRATVANGTPAAVNPRWMAARAHGAGEPGLPDADRVRFPGELGPSGFGGDALVRFPGRGQQILDLAGCLRHRVGHERQGRGELDSGALPTSVRSIPVADARAAAESACSVSSPRTV